MSRFEDGGEDGMPWELWEQVVSRALAGHKGQQQLAELEAALLALPERRLIRSHLAAHGAVCAVGAYVAGSRARRDGNTIAEQVAAMQADSRCWCGHGRKEHDSDGCCQGINKGWRADIPDRPCSCDGYEPEPEDAFRDDCRRPERRSVAHPAWHLAYLNDEQFCHATPEERYERMLAFVRRALGREAVAA